MSTGYDESPIIDRIKNIITNNEGDITIQTNDGLLTGVRCIILL